MLCLFSKRLLRLFCPVNLYGFFGPRFPRVCWTVRFALLVSSWHKNPKKSEKSPQSFTSLHRADEFLLNINVFQQGWKWYNYSLLIKSVTHIAEHVCGTGFWVSGEIGDRIEAPEAHPDGCASLSVYRRLSVDFALCPLVLRMSSHSALNMWSHFSFMHVMSSFIHLFHCCYCVNCMNHKSWKLCILRTFRFDWALKKSIFRYFYQLPSFGNNRGGMTLFYGFRCVLLISNICFVVMSHREIIQQVTAFVPLEISLI